MDDTTLRLYAIVRSDLEMPAGKLAAQAGHAFLEAFLVADEETAKEYRADGVGTKITLQARNLNDLLWAQYHCERRGISCALIVDEGHVMLPHFDGNPVVTALGIGPIRREDNTSLITNKFRKV